MLLGYNTNGLAHHDPLDAVNLLADLGYRSVALTIDHGLLSPRDDNWRGQLRQLERLLAARSLRTVIETGARFLLDPRTKHEPTLMTSDPEGRRHRVDFYRHAIEVAAELGSGCVSLWSGILREPLDAEAAFARLGEGLEEVLAAASRRNVAVGFEPEPGMFVDTMARYEELLGQMGGDDLRLTLDVGHLHCLGELPIAAKIHHWAPRLVNVHLEDMRRGVHEHLMFGDGEIEFPPVFEALRAAGYAGGIHVELSRHSHEGPEAARRAMEFVRPLINRSEA